MFAPVVRIYDRLLDSMAAIGAAAMSLMAVWISFEVVMRYFFNSPTIWAIDLAEYALLWGTFLAAPWLVRQDGHVRVESLLMHLNLRQQHTLGMLTAILSAAVCIVVFWQGLDATLEAFNRQQVIARSWRVPRALVWSVIPLGSLFLTIEFIRAAARSAVGRRDEQAFTHHAAEERAV
jgi:TRAP-type C4-dicarboxylate transport system permease small subunit